MKIFISLIIYLTLIFPVFGNEIDNKELICEYNADNANRPNEYYWFSDGQVFKVWFDNKKSKIKKSTYPAYYKLTADYIRFYRIFVLLNNLEFTDRNNNILGECKFTKTFKNIEESIINGLN